ncbi:hypothetical protein QBC41DRAFT_306133 [Cercophora samala]|uniref:Uncharacterized protein n=1 Tax=Cercophora samala TaxID=330535 RepID=A0AA39Z7K8_9PEZI|nr:hypothetical protein QBC41DRAFT_306133 [Cercophora samala]
MHLPMQFFLVAALLPGLGVAAHVPPSAEDGPDKLEVCGCTRIAHAMMKCQEIDWKSTNSEQEIRDCICISNEDRDNEWFTHTIDCRECLTPTSDDYNMFFYTFERTFTTLLLSCSNPGGSVTADGHSICASNKYSRACASLKSTGKDSWASYEVFGPDSYEAYGRMGYGKSNGTMALNLVNPNGDDTDTDSDPDDEEISANTTLPTAISSESSPTGDDQAVSTARTQGNVTTTQTQEAVTTTQTEEAATGTETIAADVTTTPTGSSAAIGAVAPGFVVALALGMGSLMF